MRNRPRVLFVSPQPFFEWRGSPILLTTLADYNDKNINIFFYNIIRCWKASANSAEIFANMSYFLFNYEFQEIDTCMWSYHVLNRKCEFAEIFNADSAKNPLKREMVNFYNEANDINEYFRKNDTNNIWLKRVNNDWITIESLRDYKVKKATTKLPVVDINFALLNVDKLISHYAELK